MWEFIIEPIFLVTIVFSLWLGCFVFLHDKRRLVHRLFTVSALIFSAWLIVDRLSNAFNNLFLLRLSYALSVFIPASTFWFIAVFTETRIKKTIVRLCGLGALLVFAVSLSPLHIKKVYSITLGKFEGELGIGFYLWSLYIAVTVLGTLYLAVKAYLKSPLARRSQIKYVLLALSVPGIFCIISEVILPACGNNRLMLFDPLAMLAYFALTAYAIVRHQLLDIRIVATRAAVFVLIYAVVLGIPLWLGYGYGLWRYATWIMLIMATIGPFIYNYLHLQLERTFFRQEKLKLAEEEQARRQKTMDTFSASLAHEIINPIYAIMGLVGVLKERVANDLKSRLTEKEEKYFNERFDQLIELSLRIDKMIKAIREFSAKTTGEFSSVVFNDVADSCLLIIEPQLKEEGIECRIAIEPNLRFRGNKILIEDVLINLAINAIYAIKYADSPEKAISLKAVRRDNLIRIEFTDTGCGIPEHLLEDIFLDFVTTKPSSQNLGMGLSRARRIIQQHHGKIWARSEGENKGAAICIELPLV